MAEACPRVARAGRRRLLADGSLGDGVARHGVRLPPAERSDGQAPMGWPVRVDPGEGEWVHLDVPTPFSGNDPGTAPFGTGRWQPVGTGPARGIAGRVGSEHPPHAPSGGAAGR